MRLDHPIHTVAPYLNQENTTTFFSFYRYIPDSPLDERRIVEFQCGKNGVDRAITLSKQTLLGEEFCMHSLLIIEGQRFHIPMLDLSCKDLDDYHISRMAKYLDEELFGPFKFFHSGRSFHAYGSTLIREQDWSYFLGSALLVNELLKEPIVDTRWIGHRLRSGYASLRWTANCHHSLQTPVLVSI